ncbi:hypothetical protein KQI88_06950 [Alkaliphilus sp. MSJ-5]|uniref:Fibronectin type-III domain-containing protein n=1 Tax=Alkaliphilus flagellatus TaxID=2841507 RepID=A0ABS6G0X6_9FIRM|nr:PA14 domain-containing protein [Alkaliphilus flagellatus]MBU5676150.1 hypothetical protein [Alkaliphilus flagellatus]
MSVVFIIQSIIIPVSDPTMGFNAYAIEGQLSTDDHSQSTLEDIENESASEDLEDHLKEPVSEDLEEHLSELDEEGILEIELISGESNKNSSVSDEVYGIVNVIIDITPPSIPENLKVEEISDSYIALSWDESIDDQEVKGYILYRDGDEIAIVDRNYYQDDDLDTSTTYEYSVAAFDYYDNISEKSDPIKVTTSIRIGNGVGLKGKYYDDDRLIDKKHEQLDQTINFNWQHASPAPGVSGDEFSVSWTGQIEPIFSEEYTIYIEAHGGARLWIDVENLSLKKGRIHVRNGWYLVDKKGDVDGSLEIGIYEKMRLDGTYEYAFANAGSSKFKEEKEDWYENGLQLFGASQDLKDSVRYSEQFVEDITAIDENAIITFVGHSKGGAEAAANAVANNKNAILFNPATVNLKAYGLDSSEYTASMIAYIVEGDILNTVEGWFSKPIESVVDLPIQYPVNTWNPKRNIDNGIKNHSMDAVKDAIKEREENNK